MTSTARCAVTATANNEGSLAPQGTHENSASVIRRSAMPALFVFLLSGGLFAQPLRVADTVKPLILRTVRHDQTAFTQGLVCVDAAIYESAGLIGKSSLRRVSASSGEVLAKIPIQNVFAEGLAFFGGELVQLTWHDGIAIRYEYPSLKPKPAPFKYSGEGWGLTNDDKQFIMTNGSDTLYFRNDKFEIIKKIPVTLNGRPLKHLNELEYANGYVYANVWYRDFIAVISPIDGRVRRLVDCSELMMIESPRSRDDVLNGIAYCQASGEWYLTGKNWRNMFAVKMPE